MSLAYYFYDGKQTLGPLEAAELRAKPGFGPTSLVCVVGDNGWKPASGFPDLIAPPPPPPAPAPAAPPPPPAAAPAPVSKIPESKPEITLVIPVQPKVEAAPAAEAPKPAAVAPAAAPPRESNPFNETLAPAKPADKLVLVVDDDETVRSFVEMSVMTAGFRVVTATDGQDALNKLAATPPDLIVTDLMMPGIGGYEFLRTLQGGGTRRIPVFVVTGSMLEDSTIALIRQEGNVVEFIPKPIRVAVFVAALHKHLKTTPPA